ncbi:MAG: type I DNA topoisomerase [Gammaproteobacteria bacterium]
MSKNIVIVESPAKSKTIEKYLGKGFKVLASYGHVRDLVPKEGAVDPDNDFAMKYQLIERNARHVDAIVKELKKADNLYLATDPDREGEAISWHLYELLKDRKLLKNKQVFRVIFHEITKNSILEAMKNPRELSEELVNAQQARRALDYLVGFNLSPLLWKKIRRGLSAGRVQSPALRMICEREDDIEKFVSREYWSIEADLEKDKQAFSGKLTLLHGDKLEQFTVTEESKANEVTAELVKAANGTLLVDSIEKKQRKRNPTAPFTTSTLQQEASRKLGFGASRTMRVAQQLYEGIDIGEGAVGLISYMRTDSVNLANEAVDEIRELIVERYGKENLPDKPRKFKTKAKNAQEAHEAIRPTSARNLPDDIKRNLSVEQFKLYNLIWKRTVACQMMHATIDTVGVEFECGKGNRIRATGSTLVKPGFIKVYQEGIDDAKKVADDDNQLPPMKKGDTVKLLEIRPEQHFTEPPPRYSEASLVKSLEEHGIGRPSTYASIISTLQNREYVTLDKRRFFPTDVGRVVSKFLANHFTKYVDYDFTANLEDELDAVSRGEKEWVPLMKEFWTPFKNLVDDKETSVSRSEVTTEPMDEKCPKCDKQLNIRLGKRGRFVGCSGYPECDYTRNIDGDESSSEPEVVEGRSCPECDSPLIIRTGRYGKFIGCSTYPDCKHIEPLEQPEDTGIECPKCNKNNILKRKSRRGKIFFSCAGYPDCDYAIWNKPVPGPCPECNWPILSVKTTKKRGTERVCPQKECRFAEPWEEEEEESPSSDEQTD